MMDVSKLAILLPLLLLLLGLGLTVTIDPYVRREHRRIILTIVVLCLTLIAQNLESLDQTELIPDTAQAGRKEGEA